MSAHCCSASSTMREHCSTWASARALPREAPRACRIPCALSTRTRSPIILGGVGRSMGSRLVKPGVACPAARAAGARAKTCHGSRCGPSWWLKLPTSTCRAAASATWPIFADGATDKQPRLHLRAAGSGPAARVAGDFRRRPLSDASPLLLTALPPFASRIVVWIGRFLRRPSLRAHGAN